MAGCSDDVSARLEKLEADGLLESRPAVPASVAKSLSIESDAVLMAAVDQVCRTRKKIISPRCLTDCVEAVKTAARSASGVLKALTITAGDHRQQFAAWAAWAKALPASQPASQPANQPATHRPARRLPLRSTRLNSPTRSIVVGPSNMLGWSSRLSDLSRRSTASNGPGGRGVTRGLAPASCCAGV